MPQRRRSQSHVYGTYGNVAYAPAYEGGGALVSGREAGVARPKPKARPRERVRVRPQVRVREAGEVSLFAVAGFLVVGLMTALVLVSYVQLLVTSDQVVTLRDDLSTLQSEAATLSAEYEKVFDMERIQEAVGGTMVRPTQDQIHYIDLSEPDSVVLYQEEQGQTGAAGLVSSVKEILCELIEYFR